MRIATFATGSSLTPVCASTTCCSARIWAPCLRAADVDRFARAGERPSDHAPTWIELEDWR